MPAPPKRIGPKRRLVQWLATLVILVVPFIRVGGESLLRLDAQSRSLLFFGASLRIEEFYLFLIAVLIFVFAFLFVTMLFGRVWCGWLCPQTTLGDLADWIDRRLGRLGLPVLSRLLRQVSYLALSLLVASNLIWYFIPPGEFVSRLAAGRLGPVAGISLASVALLVYLDLALVRRSFCKTVCPYGRIQLLTMERSTLTLEFDPRLKGECLRCGACVRACPTGIDIRDGLQIECINCGRCLDACRGVMEKRGRDGLIHYTFGSAEQGGGRPWNRRSALFAAVLALLCGIFAWGVGHRSEATLKVQRSAGGEVKRLPDGAVVNFYAVYLENRGTRAARYDLEAGALPGHRVELIGPVRGLELAANENRRVDLVLKLTPAPAAAARVQLKLLREGKPVAEAHLPVLAQ
ncbi:cytochrome c oxidase accessory protein CcoG [Geomonas silvestris]|uniref:Cytochrome c oxidase accessory protein CcoG n=1 Tax=Geomonas silvestris TaxID=2740184 RepID=A0A6V8MEA3_9BACT|nr:4Fe-4S dicluster domain-containing protein [Geomonas silvestris]GFO58318.1 cytochrome c oxidase accessory protein CcoG [Geomonas silvestris]